MEQKLSQKLSRKGTRLYVSSVSGSSKPTVILTHGMWGNHKVLQRHAKMFNELGHTTVSFNYFRASTIKDKSPFSAVDYLRFMIDSLIEQMTDVLDSVEGDKIIFTMSGPSLAGFVASDQRSDIKKFICDGGPFKQTWLCTFRLMEITKKIPTTALRALYTTGAIFYWGPHDTNRLQKVLERWRRDVPILSMRGGSDPIVRPENIDVIFKGYGNLDFTAFEIEGAGHLDGLKLYPEVYTKKIREFLNS